MGGWDGAIKTDTYAYDPSANSVTARDALNQGRTGFAACQYQGKIYVFGGTSDANTTGAEALSSVECYDPATNAWTTLPPLPKALYYLTGAQIGGKMYLFGGINSGGTAVKDIYEYDL
jgi:N-acetylneuraminic acid mutarotase